jgi:hypothetical protein
MSRYLRSVSDDENAAQWRTESSIYASLCVILRLRSDYARRVRILWSMRSVCPRCCGALGPQLQVRPHSRAATASLTYRQAYYNC